MPPLLCIKLGLPGIPGGLNLHGLSGPPHHSMGQGFWPSMYQLDLQRKSATHHGLKPKQTITAQGCHKAWYRLRIPLWSWLCGHPLHGCCPATCSFAKPLGQANWMALPWTAGVVGPQPQQGQCMCSQNQPWYSDTSLTRKAFAGRVGGCLQC